MTSLLNTLEVVDPGVVTITGVIALLTVYRFLRIYRRLVLLAVILSTSGGLYWCGVDRAQDIGLWFNGEDRFLVGRLGDVTRVGNHSIATLKDPSGDLTVIFQNDLPPSNAFIVVCGTRQITASGEPYILSRRRFAALIEGNLTNPERPPEAEPPTHLKKP